MKKRTKEILEERKRTLLALIKERDSAEHVERELALLAIDVVLALRMEKLAKAGCHCFREIEFAMSGTLRKKLSEETRDLINEMLILDELDKKHGPDLGLAFDLAQRIISKQGNRILAGVSSLPVSVVVNE